MQDIGWVPTALYFNELPQSLLCFNEFIVCELIFLPDVQPINKEVLADTDVTISCVITGVTQKLDSVFWTKDGTDVTALSGSNYVVSAGVYGSNSQTTTLTVKAAANTADSTYTCVITSEEHQETNKPTVVSLNVFSKFHKPLSL